MTVGYRATTQLIYEALTDSKLMSTYTQSPASLDAKVGGTFSLFGGSIQGKFVQLEKDKTIEQLWRFSDWPVDVYSNVRIELTSRARDEVVIKLIHKAIPSIDRFGNGDQLDKVRSGWNNFFWDRFSKILGYAKIDIRDDSDDDD